MTRKKAYDAHINLKLPQAVVDEIDSFVKKGAGPDDLEYESRSAFIREAVEVHVLVYKEMRSKA